MTLISLSHRKKMAERDPDYPQPYLMEKLYLVSNSDSVVAVIPAEDIITDCSNALKAQARCFACHPWKYEHMHKLQQVEPAHKFTAYQLLLL